MKRFHFLRPWTLHCYLIALLFPGSLSAADWTGGGANLNWSTTANWSDNASPAGKNILFNNEEIEPIPTVTSIVDQSFSIGTLNIIPRVDVGDGTIGHTVQIGPDHTLTVGGNMVLGGRHPTFNNHRATYVTFTGGGHLIAQSSVSVPETGGGQIVGTVDISGLSSFQATNAGTFIVGQGNGSNLTFRLSSVTNSIISDELIVGGHSSSGALQNRMELGTSNTLRTDQLVVSTIRNSGWLGFQTGLPADPTPSVTIRNRAGTGRVGEVIIGKAGINNVSPTGNMDFTGGTVDALVNTLTLGWQDSTTNANAGVTGILTLAAGTFDANTVLLGRTDGGAASGSNRGTGELHLNGGTFIAGTIELARDNAADHDRVTGRITLNGSTLRAENIFKGAGGGIAEFRWNSGTIANRAGGDLEIASSIPLLMRSASDFVFAPDSGRTITVDSAIQDDFAGTPGPVVLNGAGTLLLNGTVQTSVVVNQGTLGGNGTINGASTIAAGATISPGNSVGILTFGGNLTLEAGSSFDWEFLSTGTAGTDYDTIHLGANTLILPESGEITLHVIGLSGHTVNLGDTFTLVTGNVANFDPLRFNIVNQSDWSGGWALSEGSLILTAVPEPSAGLLLGLGTLAALFLRKRRTQSRK